MAAMADGFEVEVEAHGPVFMPNIAGDAFHDMMEATRDDVMGEARDLAYQISQENFQSHPTLRWERSLEVVDFSYALAQLADPVIYRCWLEGDGSRNQATRFKGYWTFRRTFNKMRVRAVDIAETAAEKAARFLNG